MDFRLSPQEEAFRQEVRDWLKDNLPKEEAGDRMSRMADPESRNVCKTFAQKLAEKKWVAPAWPVEYGALASVRLRMLNFGRLRRSAC